MSGTSQTARRAIPTALTVAMSLVVSATAQVAVPQVRHEDLRAGNREKMRYFLLGPLSGPEAPMHGYSLMVILPGGDGGPDFLPFVKRLCTSALPGRYLVAELAATKWSPEQEIAWPTANTAVPKAEFTTEEFIQAVIDDVGKRHKVNPKQTFLLGWSSSGPAVYAASLGEHPPAAGYLVAMSVFKPDQLPRLDRAAGQAYLIYHSPQDKVCPFRMAVDAQNRLREHGAEVMFMTYSGGHGWRGDVYGDVRKAVDWLEKTGGAASQPARAAASQPGTSTKPAATHPTTGPSATSQAVNEQKAGARLKVVKLYRKSRMDEKAGQILQEIVDEYPDTKAAEDARNQLKELQQAGASQQN